VLLVSGLNYLSRVLPLKTILPVQRTGYGRLLVCFVLFSLFGESETHQPSATTTTEGNRQQARGSPLIFCVFSKKAKEIK